MGEGRILVVGGDSVIGAALVRRLRRDGRNVLATTRRPESVSGDRILLDLAEEPGTWPALPRVDVAIICAAVVGFTSCSDDPEGSARVNVIAPGALARHFAGSDTAVIYLSSNAVFDGSVAFSPAAHPPSPTTEYGRQKSAAETLILRSSAANAVLRLSKVLTPGNRLLRDWVGELRAGRPIKVFSDFVLAPLDVDFVTAIMLRLIEARATGIFQASGDEDIAYTELAVTLAQTMEVDTALITPVAAVETGMLVEGSGANTTLDMNEIEALTGLGPPSSKATIKTVIDAALRTPAH